MQSHTLKYFLTLSLLLGSCPLAASPAKAQDRITGPKAEVPMARGNCPKPIAVTLTATTPTVVNADFSAAQLGAPRAWLNDPAPNKSFLYTFQWSKAEGCCEITGAVLTVKLKANQSGSQNGSDSGNDGIAIMHLGSVVAPFSQPVYSSWPFNPGLSITKTWTLTGAALNNLNANHRLSIYVQDDTRVESATLQIPGCCVNARSIRTAEAPVGINPGL